MSSNGCSIDNISNFSKLLNRVHIDHGTGCWEYAGTIRRYGYFSVKEGDGKCHTRLAHRVSYRFFNGELISGMVIDHTCKNKVCVNPDHLRQVTTRFNVIDNSIGPCSENSKKTHCKRGHLFDDKNTYFIKGNGGRMCRKCHNEYEKNRKASK